MNQCSVDEFSPADDVTNTDVFGEGGGVDGAVENDGHRRREVVRGGDELALEDELRVGDFGNGDNEDFSEAVAQGGRELALAEVTSGVHGGEETEICYGDDGLASGFFRQGERALGLKN